MSEAAGRRRGPRGRRGRSRDADNGQATAEIAVALPSLVLVLGVAVGAVEAAAAHVACVDAARIGARALARDEEPQEVRRLARQAAPPEATVELGGSPEFARVTVRAPARPVPLVTVPLRVGGAAATPREPRH